MNFSENYYNTCASYNGDRCSVNETKMQNLTVNKHHCFERTQTCNPTHTYTHKHHTLTNEYFYSNKCNREKLRNNVICLDLSYRCFFYVYVFLSFSFTFFCVFFSLHHCRRCRRRFIYFTFIDDCSLLAAGLIV